jgi:hypothetical protein
MLRPRAMIARAMAASWGSSGRPRMNDLVDLEDVQRQALEVAQRRIAGAEVVDRQLHAQFLSWCSTARASSAWLMMKFSVISSCRSAGLSGSPSSCSMRPAGRVAQLRAGEVDDSGPKARSPASSVHLPAGLFQHPVADLQDHAVLFGQVDEVLGRHLAEGRVVQRISASAPTSSGS